MKKEDMRQALINSTIHTIAEVGIDHATTKLLAKNAGLNEVYIYRIFGGKEQLFKETFTHIDKEFASTMLKIVPNVYRKDLDVRSRFREIFSELWKYSLQDKERCSFFIRYYYSRCYTKAVSEERKETYANVLNKFSLVFVYSADTWWYFNHIMDVIFSSAVKVLREEIPDNAETEEKIFSLLFAVLEPHLK